MAEVDQLRGELEAAREEIKELKQAVVAMCDTYSSNRSEKLRVKAYRFVAAKGPGPFSAAAVQAEVARLEQLDRDRDEQRIAEALLSNARLLWSLSLSGRPTAHQKAAFEWMQAIRPGILVAETSSSEPALERVGVVESIRGDVVTITCLDGQAKRWSNATFVRVPRNDVERAEVVNLANAM